MSVFEIEIPEIVALVNRIISLVCGIFKYISFTHILELYKRCQATVLKEPFHVSLPLNDPDFMIEQFISFDSFAIGGNYVKFQCLLFRIEVNTCI